MDRFIFKASATAALSGDSTNFRDGETGDLVAVSAGHDPMEIRTVWGTDGASGVANPALTGMHVDPVIPGGGDRFEDPSFGFEDPLFG